MDAGTGGWYRREAVRHGWRDRQRRSEEEDQGVGGIGGGGCISHFFVEILDRGVGGIAREEEERGLCLRVSPLGFLAA
jgi:hypothetical protein